MAQRSLQVIKPILGIDLDTARELLPTNKSTFLKNAISSYSLNPASDGASGNAGNLMPLLSNANSAEFEGDFPISQCLCVGSKYDRRLNQFFFFVWNVDSFHQIWVFEGNTNVARLILERTDFNFDPHNLITSIDVVIADVSTGVINVQNLQRLLYWTDGLSQPRKINVDRALNGDYAALTFLRSPDEFFNRVKYPPLDIDIISTLANPDPTYLLNFVANKQFQFGAVYFYQDGEHTTRGAISTLYFNVNNNLNFVELHLSAGSSLVTYVELYFRLGNIGDWKRYETIPRADIIANVTYPYNNVTNIFIYKFFNNVAYTIADQADINRLFDVVPLKNYAQEITEANVIVDGNPLEGYDNLTIAQRDTPEVQVIYSTYGHLTLTLNISIAWTITVGNITATVHVIDFNTGIDSIVDTQVFNGGAANPFIYTVVIPTIDFGDVVYLNWAGAGSINNGTTITGSYTNIHSPLQCGTGNFTVTKSAGAQAGVGRVTLQTINSDPCGTWDTATKDHDTVKNYAGGWAQLKQGGTYIFDFVLYDDALRSTFVQHTDALKSLTRKITIESIQKNSAFQNFEIRFLWNALVLPDWVKYVKVVRTKNLNIDRSLGTGYLQFGITNVLFLKYDHTAGVPGVDTIVKVAFTVNNLIQFNTDYFENTTTTYTWTQGDRIQFIRNGDGTWFDFATFGLIDKELSTDPAAPDVVFICDYSTGLAGLVAGAWIEFYTPAKEDQTNLYYEITDFIPTTGLAGNNQVNALFTILNTWDTYPAYWSTPYILALVNDTGVTPFEHHSIYLEGTVPSNGEDIGRINVINDAARQLWYPARVRRTNAYLPNTFLNRLSTNVEENKHDYDRAKGGIVNLFADGYKLHLLQEDDCCIVMMAKQLVTLADGGNQLVANSEFFSDPIQIDGNGGCQNSESFVENGGLMWWADAKRGAWVECDWRTVKDIARLGMIKSYAERKLKFICKKNQSEFADKNFWIIPSGLDPKSNSYLTTCHNCALQNSMGTPSKICIDLSAQLLTHQLVNGVFSSPDAPPGSVFLFSGTDYYFDPTISGAGTWTIVETDGTNTIEKTIIVSALPVVTLAAFPTVSVANSPYFLTGGSPLGGVYTISVGNAVVNYIDRNVYAPATYTITYTYTNPETGCQNTDQKPITVT